MAEMTAQSDRDAFVSLMESLVTRFKKLNDRRVEFSLATRDDRLKKKYLRAYGDCGRLRTHVTNAIALLASPHDEKTHAELERIRHELGGLFSDHHADPSLYALARQVTSVFDEYEAYLLGLDACLKDVQRWPTYRLSNGMESFVMRLRTYLAGGILEGIGQPGQPGQPGGRFQLKGLRSSRFGQEIAKWMQESMPIRKLNSYPALLAFVKKMDEAIKAAIKNPGWEGFYGKDGFYANLDKGKNYIRMMEQQFGNEEVAAFLKNLKERFHENPEVWITQLDGLQRRLADYTYQNQAVLYPAMQAIGELLRRAEEGTLVKSGLKKHLSTVLAGMERGIGEAERAADEDARRMHNVFARLDNRMAMLIEKRRREMEGLIIEGGGLGREEMRLVGDSIAGRERALPVLKAGLRSFGRGRIGEFLFGAAAVDRGFGTMVAVASDSAGKNLLERARTLAALMERDVFPHLRRVELLIRHYDKKFTVPLSERTELLPEVEALVREAAAERRKRAA
ncbi:TPA: hypothetical protein HA295_04875 [Candidatus Woesearchaeota archaeon]|nr:hypothetical protein [Candidatus Woesearchaeota archaeon]HII66081.1 hypothetical protein [Candidatus Woesearchaeota archaeon]